MQSQIPLPTDNIYKFYSLLGLLIIIFCFGSIIYVVQSTNQLFFQSSVEYESLSSNKNRTAPEEAKLQALEAEMEIAKENKRFYLSSLRALICFGLLSISYGFIRWHTFVQPQQNELTRLTIKKLKQEVGEEDHPKHSA